MLRNVLNRRNHKHDDKTQASKDPEENSRSTTLETSPAAESVELVYADSAPLSDSSRGFRVLDLLPGDPDSDISCEFRVATLSNSPLYIAVSYTWGDRNEKKRIYSSSGHYLEVRKNLYDLLKDLRHSRHRRTLWIDAICIDQENVPERNAQLGIIGDIFHNVTSVISWLHSEVVEDDARPRADIGASIIAACNPGEEIDQATASDLSGNINAFSATIIGEGAGSSKRLR